LIELNYECNDVSPFRSLWKKFAEAERFEYFDDESSPLIYKGFRIHRIRLVKKGQEIIITNFDGPTAFGIAFYSAPNLKDLSLVSRAKALLQKELPDCVNFKAA
jgi:hypothetical protein